LPKIQAIKKYFFNIKLILVRLKNLFIIYIKVNLIIKY